MQNHAGIVAILNFIINLLMIVGTNALFGCVPDYRRILLAASAGGLYGGACLLPRFVFLGYPWWRVICLVVVGIIAYGINKASLKIITVFILLCLSLDIAASAIFSKGMGQLFLAGGVMLLCLYGPCIKMRGTSLVPVELCYGGKHLCLTALNDTGNTLYDPVTGKSVLVVGADIAQELTGLTKEHLRRPLDAIANANVAGLRLIPYHTIDKASGMLLALHIPYVKVGSWHGSGLIAFAPEGLGREERYQALTGGAL